MNQLQLFLPCAAGVEDYLATEVLRITELPPGCITKQRGGVAVRTGFAHAMLLNLYSRLAQRCEETGIVIERNLIGSYCTSLDMVGFSITLLKADDETLALWDAPVHTPALNWGK